MAKFEPELYRRYRIAYPASVFAPLKVHCNVLSGHPLKVLDLGVGTGLASRSFAEFYSHCQFTWIEPDQAMLTEALSTFRTDLPVQAMIASAENFECEALHDLVLIGSAWHWMNPDLTLNAILKVLKPGGIIWVGEYQFPKALGDQALELNEWVRREFNLRWKPQSQVPRGSLEALTQPIRNHDELSQISAIVCEENQQLDLDSFLGVIYSQSRYLVYEQLLGEAQKNAYRAHLRSELISRWGPQEARDFLYTFRAYVFHRRNF